MKKLILVTVFVFLSAVATQAQVASNDCDSSLWQRVYSRYRFAYPVRDTNKNEPPHRCVQIKGKIDHITPVNPEGDGDIDIAVVPDNKGVLKTGQNFLVLEIICADNTPGIGPAKTPCKNYHIPPHLSYDRVRKFKRGQHVQIVGELVVDYLHVKTGSVEVHPVSKIDPIP